MLVFGLSGQQLCELKACVFFDHGSGLGLALFLASHRFTRCQYPPCRTMVTGYQKAGAAVEAHSIFSLREFSQA